MKKNKSPKVLVVGIVNPANEYCSQFFKKFYNKLKYRNKLAVFIDDDSYPQLRAIPSGEEREATRREIAIQYSFKKKADFILFMDCRIEPENDTIEKLLSYKKPVVGALTCFHNDSYFADVFNYKKSKFISRKWLKQKDFYSCLTVDFVSSKLLLIAKSIFDRVNFTEYKGFHNSPNAYQSVDEWLISEIEKRFKIKPLIASDCRPWFYHYDGFAYKLFGHNKVWKNI